MDLKRVDQMAWRCAVIFLILILDQWSKWLVVHSLTLGETVPIIKDFFYIASHRNRGAAFGLLQGQRALFIVVAVLVLFLLSYYVFKAKPFSTLVVNIYAVVLGGILGNLIDRIFRGEVVDFLLFKFGQYDFPTFNFADTAIVSGMILLGILMLGKGDISSG